MKYDFISIRSPLDQSKYCVDLIVKMAEQMPMYSFCLIGKGHFFEYNLKPKNMDWLDNELSHEDMADYLNRSRIALFPTREDTQGLMACELATYGMPLITSSIDVCEIVFRNCPNVSFIDNTAPNIMRALSELKAWDKAPKWDEYFARNTVSKEIALIKSI